MEKWRREGKGREVTYCEDGHPRRNLLLFGSLLTTWSCDGAVYQSVTIRFSYPISGLDLRFHENFAVPVACILRLVFSTGDRWHCAPFPRTYFRAISDRYQRIPNPWTLLYVNQTIHGCMLHKHEVYHWNEIHSVSRGALLRVCAAYSHVLSDPRTEESKGWVYVGVCQMLLEKML